MTIKLDSLRVESDDAEWQDSAMYPDVRYKVRPLDIAPFQQKRDALFRKLRQIHKDAAIPDRISKPQLGKIVAQELLDGWEGFDVEFSREVAVERLSEWEYRNVVDDIIAAAARQSQALGVYLEDAAKNSGKPSDSTSN